MPEYRLYCLDQAGHVQRRFDFEATDHASAIADASNYHAGTDCELWSGKFRIAKLQGDGSIQKD